MMQTIAITPQWQIYIPLEARQILGLLKPGLAEIRVVQDEIIIKPKPSLVLQLAGKYRQRRSAQKINIEKIRDQIDYSQL